MKIAGIICEYNPLHLGHLYQMEKTAEIIGEDAGIVCLMSGNFVQRGEPALFDKHLRALSALRSGAGETGADLVLELPITCAIDSAEGFGSGAVKILHSLGVVDTLSFGSECGDVKALDAAAETLLSAAYPEKLKSFLDSKVSYAKARQLAAEAIDPASARVLANPNDILGVEYLKARKDIGSSMTPLAISRMGVNHDAGETGGGFASASSIRKMILSGKDGWQSYVPERAAALIERATLEKRGPYCLANGEKALLYRLRTMSDGDYDLLPFGSEGLSNRFRRFARTGTSSAAIIDAVKTKRYAHARVRRMTLCAFLSITEADMRRSSPYIRVLAFNDRGREIIGMIKERGTLPLLQHGKHARKLGVEAKRYFELECRCADLFSLCAPVDSLPETRWEWEKGSLYPGKTDVFI